MADSLRFPERSAVLVLLLGSLGLTVEARADDEPARFRVSGLVQVDGVLLDQTSIDELDPATREPLNNERFILQRAWLRGEAQYPYVRGLVVAEGTTARTPSFRLFSAELSLFYPQVDRPLIALTLGLFLIPFGLETHEGVERRMFLEQSTWVQALFPGRRDLGARVAGEWSFLRYSLAAMNGNPIDDASLPLRDPNRAKDLIGRLGIDDDLTPGIRVAAGVSALFGRGFHPGVAPTKDTVTVRDVNEDGIAQPSEIQFVAGEPGEPSHNFDRRALAGDLSMVYALPFLGVGRIYGEVAWAVNLDRSLFVSDPIATGRDARQLGFTAAVRQAVTEHAEIGLRYDRYEPDRDRSERRGTRIVPYDATFTTVGAAVAWCTLPYLRFTLQYDHRTNPLGRDVRGAPVTLAADSLILRGQLEL